MSCGGVGVWGVGVMGGQCDLMSQRHCSMGRHLANQANEAGGSEDVSYLGAPVLFRANIYHVPSVYAI